MKDVANRLLVIQELLPLFPNACLEVQNTVSNTKHEVRNDSHRKIRIHMASLGGISKAEKATAKIEI